VAEVGGGEGGERRETPRTCPMIYVVREEVIAAGRGPSWTRSAVTAASDDPYAALFRFTSALSRRSWLCMVQHPLPPHPCNTRRSVLYQFWTSSELYILQLWLNPCPTPVHQLVLNNDTYLVIIAGSVLRHGHPPPHEENGRIERVYYPGPHEKGHQCLGTAVSASSAYPSVPKKRF
jgi:hypothetical protein